jgi:hypothetical protein
LLDFILSIPRLHVVQDTNLQLFRLSKVLGNRLVNEF